MVKHITLTTQTCLFILFYGLQAVVQTGVVVGAEPTQKQEGAESQISPLKGDELLVQIVDSSGENKTFAYRFTGSKLTLPKQILSGADNPTWSRQHKLISYRSQSALHFLDVNLRSQEVSPVGDWLSGDSTVGWDAQGYPYLITQNDSIGPQMIRSIRLNEKLELKTIEGSDNLQQYFGEFVIPKISQNNDKNLSLMSVANASFSDSQLSIESYPASYKSLKRIQSRIYIADIFKNRGATKQEWEALMKSSGNNSYYSPNGSVVRLKSRMKDISRGGKTAKQFSDSSPNFSSDGSSIGFTRANFSNRSVYPCIYNTQTGKLTELDLSSIHLPVEFALHRRWGWPSFRFVMWGDTANEIWIQDTSKTTLIRGLRNGGLWKYEIINSLYGPEATEISYWSKHGSWVVWNYSVGDPALHFLNLKTKQSFDVELPSDSEVKWMSW